MKDERETCVRPRTGHPSPVAVAAFLFLLALLAHYTILTKYIDAGTLPSKSSVVYQHSKDLVSAEWTACDDGGRSSAQSVALVVPGLYFVESAEGLAAMLERVGMQSVGVKVILQGNVSLQPTELDEYDLCIMFMPSLIGPPSAYHRCVWYQTEQLNSIYLTSEVVHQMAQAQAVWDFSFRQAEHWRVKHNITSSYVPFMPRPTPSAPDYLFEMQNLFQPIDLLFFGHPNQRREELFARCKELGSNLGLHTEFHFDNVLWGEARDRKLKMSKVVLNAHYYPGAVLEVHRINYLLSKGVAVVSERSSDTELDAMYEGSVVFADSIDLVAQKAVELVLNSSRRQSLAMKGWCFIHCVESELNRMHHVRTALAGSGIGLFRTPMREL